MWISDSTFSLFWDEAKASRWKFYLGFFPFLLHLCGILFGFRDGCFGSCLSSLRLLSWAFQAEETQAASGTFLSTFLIPCLGSVFCGVLVVGLVPWTRPTPRAARSGDSLEIARLTRPSRSWALFSFFTFLFWNSRSFGEKDAWWGYFGNFGQNWTVDIQNI